MGLPPIEQLRKIASGEAPETLKARSHIRPGVPVTEDKHMGFGYTVKVCLTNPRIWGVSVAFFCLDIIRYGFFYWAPVFLIEVQGATISSAGLSVAVLPMAGSAGSIFCGWATGRFFDNRRAPVICLCLFGLAIFSYLFYYAPEGAWYWA